MHGNHLNYNIVDIFQNTEKSPGDLRKLAVTQTPVINHQLSLEGKTLKEKSKNKESSITKQLHKDQLYLYQNQ